MSRVPGERRPHLTTRRRMTGRSLAAGATAALAGAVTAGRARAWLGPVQMTARLGLAPGGGTTLDVPPLGSADIATHRGPIQLRLLATGVDSARATGLLRMPDSPEDSLDVREQLAGLLDSARHDAASLARVLGLRALAGAVAGMAIAVRTGRRPAAFGGAAAVTTIAALASATRDPQAWRTPELTGLLERAPLLLGDLRTAPDRIGTYRDQLAELVRTGTDVYQKIAALPEAPPPDAIRLLHISDVHLSPVTYPLAKALVEQYDVDAVVDTGDLVDWGTPAETAFAGQIAGLTVPYLYVKGNHDSSAIADAVGRQPNATVLDLDDDPVEIAGLRFAGMADPRFTPDKTTGDDHAVRKVTEQAREFRDRLTGPVDILLVHDPSAARELAGKAPTILSGHTHVRAARQVGDTVVITQGTSGGSGLRGVQQDPPTPVSLSVLYVDRATKRLWGADEVTVGGLGETTVSIARRRLADLIASWP